MKGFRVVVISMMVAGALVAGSGQAGADPIKTPWSGLSGVLFAPFVLACWAITHTGSDTPSPQCNAIFAPLGRAFGEFGS